jgi:hypothetical protein
MNPLLHQKAAMTSATRDSIACLDKPAPIEEDGGTANIIDTTADTWADTADYKARPSDPMASMNGF